ncbi:MAG TPA: transposase, partial [Methylomirabilota bacterium]|nr:transposase [Methylomirabilota bacterium]
MQAQDQQADRAARGRLLDEYCRITGGHRKAAIRRLRTAPRGGGRGPGRPRQYVASALTPVLERAWLASDQLSGKLLRPVLPALLTARATRHGVPIAPDVRAALGRA